MPILYGYFVIVLLFISLIYVHLNALTTKSIFVFLVCFKALIFFTHLNLDV